MILTGGIDLSVGSIVAVTGVASVLVAIAGWPALLAMAAGVAIGAACGLLNGALTAYLALAPFIVTLGTMTFLRGLAYTMTNGQPIVSSSLNFKEAGIGYLAGIPIPVLIMAVVYVVSWFVLERTRFGRHVYAVGGNVQAARLAGVRVLRVTTSVYVIGGACAGIAGIIFAARVISAQPTAGTGYELDAIAAVVLGGTSLSGGRGRIAGTLIGSVILGVLSTELHPSERPVLHPAPGQGHRDHPGGCDRQPEAAPICASPWQSRRRAGPAEGVSARLSDSSFLSKSKGVSMPRKIAIVDPLGGARRHEPVVFAVDGDVREPLWWASDDAGGRVLCQRLRAEGAPGRTRFAASVSFEGRIALTLDRPCSEEEAAGIPGIRELKPREADAFVRLDTGAFDLELCSGTAEGLGSSKWGLRHFRGLADGFELLPSGNNAIGGFYGPFFTPENGLINPPSTPGCGSRRWKAAPSCGATGCTERSRTDCSMN